MRLTTSVDKLVRVKEELQAHNPNPRAQILLYQAKGHVLNILRRTLAMHKSHSVADLTVKHTCTCMCALNITFPIISTYL